MSPPSSLRTLSHSAAGGHEEEKCPWLCSVLPSSNWNTSTFINSVFITNSKHGIIQASTKKINFIPAKMTVTLMLILFLREKKLKKISKMMKKIKKKKIPNLILCKFEWCFIIIRSLQFCKPLGRQGWEFILVWKEISKKGSKEPLLRPSTWYKRKNKTLTRKLTFTIAVILT